MTPFLFTLGTLPISVWTFTAIPVYVVWNISRSGGRWVVPGPVMLVEYGLPVAAAAFLLYRRWSKSQFVGRGQP